MFKRVQAPREQSTCGVATGSQAHLRRSWSRDAIGRFVRVLRDASGVGESGRSRREVRGPSHSQCSLPADSLFQHNHQQLKVVVQPCPFELSSSGRARFSGVVAAYSAAKSGEPDVRARAWSDALVAVAPLPAPQNVGRSSSSTDTTCAELTYNIPRQDGQAGPVALGRLHHLVQYRA